MKEPFAMLSGNKQLIANCPANVQRSGRHPPSGFLPPDPLGKAHGLHKVDDLSASNPDLRLEEVFGLLGTHARVSRNPRCLECR